jgi:hypothetical protein
LHACVKFWAPMFCFHSKIAQKRSRYKIASPLDPMCFLKPSTSHSDGCYKFLCNLIPPRNCHNMRKDIGEVFSDVISWYSAANWRGNKFESAPNWWFPEPTQTQLQGICKSHPTARNSISKYT